MHISLVLVFPGNAEVDIRWGGNQNIVWWAVVSKCLHHKLLKFINPSSSHKRYNVGDASWHFFVHFNAYFVGSFFPR